MRQQIPNLLRLKSMASPFEQLSSRMDALTASRFGKTIEINGNPCTVVEFHYLAEMGELSGDAIRLVVFTSSYRPRRNDQVVMDGKDYMVATIQWFNGKPQITLE